jgi:hypothetical protein
MIEWVSSEPNLQSARIMGCFERHETSRRQDPFISQYSHLKQVGEYLATRPFDWIDVNLWFGFIPSCSVDILGLRVHKTTTRKTSSTRPSGSQATTRVRWDATRDDAF